ncbi:hypothetical protein HYV86_07390 [Candidatus Woesearchaeota archaeon]|nr:hypothetical protein [Candidatus Woesearchaeota archaeon]
MSDIKEHIRSLVCKGLGNEYSDSSITLFSDDGTQKIIYDVSRPTGESLLVVAVPREKEYDLPEEYAKLEHLYDKVPDFFPKPLFYEEEGALKVFGMQRFPHKSLEQQLERLERNVDLREGVSFEIGNAMGYTFALTGMYSTAPHEGNILCRTVKGTIDIKLVDAAHFEEGNLRNLRQSVQGELPWCNKVLFRNGLENGLDRGGYEK